MGSTQWYYIAEGSGEEERPKTRKIRNEEKVVGWSSAFPFPARKQETVIQGETMEPGDRPPDAEETPGSRFRQRLGGKAKQRAHSRCIHVKQEKHEHRPQDPSTTEPRLPHPI